MPVIRSIGGLSVAASNKKRGLKPIAAVGEPPAGIADGDRCGQRPPERKRHIRDQAEDRESDPKYLPLHISILDASALVMPRRVAKMFQIQAPPGADDFRDAQTIAT
jgi:hypothetical protein